MQVVEEDRYRVAVFGGKASSNSSRIELILLSIKTARIKDGIVQEQFSRQSAYVECLFVGMSEGLMDIDLNGRERERGLQESRGARRRYLSKKSTVIVP